MIERDIAPCLSKLFGQYPFVTVTGPRQSGKTTLCRTVFPHLKYINLELPDQREFAQSDPRGFLSQVGDGAILDEIQRVPELLSYLQVLADEKGKNGLFVLTGSEHLMLSDAISQSLAGRTGLLHLLPFSLAERRRAGVGGGIDEILYSGFYPRIHDQKIEPSQAFADYFETYVERDVRRLSEIRNLSTFQRFVRLCAGRIGQLTDFVALGSDAGVSYGTARNWLEVLEASFIAFRLPPFHANIRKRLVKSPKLYFYDVGLASYLIGIGKAEQIATHPLRGALFENLVVVEALKYRFNLGRRSNLSFFRDRRGLECDLLLETANSIGAIEIKSGATIASDLFDALNAIEELVPKISMKAAVYGGTERQSRSSGEVVPFDDLCDVLERFEASQEMAAFVQDNVLPAPLESEVDILDGIHSKYIRPALDALEATLGQHNVEQLFSEITGISYIKFEGNTTNSSGLLDAEHWEQSRNLYILKRGFRLGDKRPLEITRTLTFRRPSSDEDMGFNFAVSLIWSLDAEGFTQGVVIDGVSDSRLSDRIAYSEVGTRRAKVDRVCSTILRAVMDQIKDHSKTRS